MNALLRKLALKLNLVSPEGVSYLGGLGIWIAFCAIWILRSPIYGYLNKPGLGIILGSALLVIFGIIDDYKKELSVLNKFLVQIAATILLILFGIRTEIAHIGLHLNLLITFLWVLGITNAFNHLDILDGLAAGIAAISAITFFLIALLNNNPATGILALALTGAILGFLRYNLSPAKVYMGNSGSHSLGFVLSAIAIAISYAPLERKIALACPILILSLPIYDTLFLMLRRLSKGHSIFQKSDDHFALRLLAAGYSKNKTLVLMCFFSLFFCLNGLAINRVSNQIGTMIIILTVVVCLVIGRKVNRIPNK